MNTFNQKIASVVILLFVLFSGKAFGSVNSNLRNHHHVLIDGHRLFVVEDGEKYLLRGVSLSALEYGKYTNVHDTDNYGKKVADYEKIYDDIQGEQSNLMQEAKELNVNCVRIPFNLSLLAECPGCYSTTRNPENQYRFNEDYFQQIKVLISQAARRDLLVILVMHNNLEYIPNYNENFDQQRQININKNQNYHQFLGHVWQRISTETLADDNVIGFEPVNEPFVLPPDNEPFALTRNFQSNWKTIAQDIIDNIRQVDQERLILINGMNFSRAWDWHHHSDDLKTLNDPSNRLVFAPHLNFFYDNQLKTPPDNWYRKLLRDNVWPVIKWSQTNNKPVLFTYFSFLRDQEEWKPVMVELFHEFFDFYDIGAVIWELSVDGSQNTEVTDYIKNEYQKHTRVKLKEDEDIYLLKDNIHYYVKMNNWTTGVCPVCSTNCSQVTITDCQSIELNFKQDLMQTTGLTFSRGCVNASDYTKITFYNKGSDDLKLWIDNCENSLEISNSCNLTVPENYIQLSDYIELSSDYEQYVEIPLSRLSSQSTIDQVCRLNIQSINTERSFIRDIILHGRFSTIEEFIGYTESADIKLSFDIANDNLNGTNFSFYDPSDIIDWGTKLIVSCDDMKDKQIAFDYIKPESLDTSNWIKCALSNDQGPLMNYSEIAFDRYKNKIDNYFQIKLPMSDMCPEGSEFHSIQIQEKRTQDNNGLAYIKNFRMENIEKNIEEHIAIANIVHQYTNTVSLSVSISNPYSESVQSVCYSISPISDILTLTDISFSEALSQQKYYYGLSSNSDGYTTVSLYYDLTPVALNGHLMTLHYRINDNVLDNDLVTSINFDGKTKINDSECIPFDLSLNFNIPGYAMIIVGGGDHQKAYIRTAQNVYNLLSLSFGMNISDINNNRLIKYIQLDTISEGNAYSAVFSAFNEWAYENLKISDAPLFIVFIGHGNDDSIQLSTNEYLTSSTLNTWLNKLENESNQPIVFISGACDSGLFIKGLYKDVHPNRVLLSSVSGKGEDYLGFQVGKDIKDGNLFITELFSRLAQGNNLGDSFLFAKDITEFYHNYTQRPLMIGNHYNLSLISKEKSDILMPETAFEPPQKIIETGDIKNLSVDFSLFSLSNTVNYSVRSDIFETNELNPEYIAYTYTSETPYLFKTSHVFHKSGKSRIFYIINDHSKNIYYSAGYDYIYISSDSNEPPDNFDLLYPENEMTVSAFNYLIWSIPDDDDSVTYNIEIFDQSEQCVYRKQNIYDNHFVIRPDNQLLFSEGEAKEGIYKWQVTAIDSYGLTSISTSYTIVIEHSSAVNSSYIISLDIKNAVTKEPLGNDDQLSIILLSSNDSTMIIDSPCEIISIIEDGVEEQKLDIEISAPSFSKKYSSIFIKDEIVTVDGIDYISTITNNTRGNTVFVEYFLNPWIDHNQDSRINLKDAIYILQILSNFNE